MTVSFVADASVAIGWVHPKQATESTQATLHCIRKGGTILVPALWPLEVANALLVLTRRKKLREQDRQEALTWIGELPFTIDYEMSFIAFRKLSDLAQEYTLSIYDAAYLELAQRRELPLACKDGALRNAALKCNIEVW